MAKEKDDLEEAWRQASVDLPEKWEIVTRVSKGAGVIELLFYTTPDSYAVAASGPQNESLIDCVKRLTKVAVDSNSELTKDGQEEL